MSIIINGKDLTLEQIYQVAVKYEKIKLSSAAEKKVIKCREYVDKIIEQNKTVYGLNTGFGKFENVKIPLKQIDKLQENLIRSHATGVGEYFSEAETRAITLLRINVLANGNSGIRLKTLKTLIAILNAGIHPLIPEKGSVGASGDLAPLSHLALVLIGEGKAKYKGKILNGKAALKLNNIKPVKLKAKEGLALNNGTQVMTAVTALTLIKAKKLVITADICAAASIDALKGTPSAFDSSIHKLRPHPGQITSAANLKKIIQNSKLRESHKNCKNVQDAYSLRCTPQVHGAIRDNLDNIQKTIEIEINAVTDNPLIFPEENKVLSGGNFHGEPIAFAADNLGIVLSELGNISERRTEQLLNPALNRGLKPFLATKPGIDSGFMIAQLTSAALVSENKIKSHPASVDSIPTSANQEDHVSMGTIASVKARNILKNTTYVLGIELIIALQALDNRAAKSSPMIETIKSKVREKIKVLQGDRVLKNDIENMFELIDRDVIKQTALKISTLK